MMRLVLLPHSTRASDLPLPCGRGSPEPDYARSPSGGHPSRPIGRTRVPIGRTRVPIGRTRVRLGWMPSIWPLLSLLLASILWPTPALAHVGAPYPVLLEQPAGPYVISALADPDVGVGTFLIKVTLAEGQPVPPDTTITVWVMPEDGHMPETGHPAERQLTRDGERFIAKVPFDARGPWRTRFEMAGAAGQAAIGFSVEVTPPYPGVVTTLLCLLPFVLVGILWAAGALRRQQPGERARAQATTRKEAG
jgi:hypothetical protein